MTAVLLHDGQWDPNTSRLLQIPQERAALAVLLIHLNFQEPKGATQGASGNAELPSPKQIWYQNTR